MQLERLPRVALCHRPTPLEPLPRLTAQLGGPRLLVKRDDATGLALGGNKTRKLEFLLADAQQQGADTVITVGGVQSNHARQTAAAAARLGLRCELVLPQVVPRDDPLYQSGGNVLLDRLLGARLHVVEDSDAAAVRIGQIVEEIRDRGGSAYFIPTGGSSPLGAAAYVDAVAELAEQADTQRLQIDHLIVANGSHGTQAGIVAGVAALERSERVLGFSVYDKAAEARQKTLELAEQTLELCTGEKQSLDQRVVVNDDYLGQGYGQPTDAMVEAVNMLAQLEGLLLDPVYTGKAMAGLIDLVRRGTFKPDETIVFWHTGGTPALFAYQEVFSRRP